MQHIAADHIHCHYINPKQLLQMYMHVEQYVETYFTNKAETYASLVNVMPFNAANLLCHKTSQLMPCSWHVFVVIFNEYKC